MLFFAPLRRFFPSTKPSPLSDGILSLILRRVYIQGSRPCLPEFHQYGNTRPHVGSAVRTLLGLSVANAGVPSALRRVPFPDTFIRPPSSAKTPRTRSEGTAPPTSRRCLARFATRGLSGWRTLWRGGSTWTQKTSSAIRPSWWPVRYVGEVGEGTR